MRRGSWSYRPIHLYMDDAKGPAIDNNDIAEILRGVAKGREANGDNDGARRARAGARMAERRDGPGEAYRKHRATGRGQGTANAYWTDWWKK